MRFSVNGKWREEPSSMTVLDLLRGLSLDPVRVAVELNEDVLPRANYGETSIGEGDRIEIVTFVGGG